MNDLWVVNFFAGYLIVTGIFFIVFSGILSHRTVDFHNNFMFYKGKKLLPAIYYDKNSMRNWYVIGGIICFVLAIVLIIFRKTIVS